MNSRVGAGKMNFEKKVSKMKENELDKPVSVNTSNDKRRIEIEIEFLEEMLRAKREKLKKLD